MDQRKVPDRFLLSEVFESLVESSDFKTQDARELARDGILPTAIGTQILQNQKRSSRREIVLLLRENRNDIINHWTELAYETINATTAESLSSDGQTPPLSQEDVRG